MRSQLGALAPSSRRCKKPEPQEVYTRVRGSEALTLGFVLLTRSELRERVLQRNKVDGATKRPDTLPEAMPALLGAAVRPKLVAFAARACDR